MGGIHDNTFRLQLFIGCLSKLQLMAERSDRADKPAVEAGTVNYPDSISRCADTALGIDIINSETDPVIVTSVRTVEDDDISRPDLPEPRHPERFHIRP